MNVPALSEKLKVLPGSPGCYLFKDSKQEILYVGKAISLKNRVRSYFRPTARHSMRIARMVSKIADIEWVVVDSELEALILECNLIKKYLPPYNIRLRDDKSYPFIAITNEKFPRLIYTRRLRSDKSKYFGPYANSLAVRNTLALLHKIFPLIPCGKSWDGTPKQSPCLYYHLGQCMAPCAGLSNSEKYHQIIKQVERLLSGKEEGILDELYMQMEQAADELDFERAAKIRDRIKALENILQKQKVLSTDLQDRDVIAVVKDERGAAIEMLYIRGGKLIGQRHFFLDGATESSTSESVQEFVKQYYAGSPDIPKEILLPVEIAERVVVQQWLRNRKGSSVTVEVPRGGEKLNLIELAAKNAEQALTSFKLELEQKESWAEQSISQLQEALNLTTPPARIEGYDISNIQGKFAVGSMVVTENGQAEKTEYRRFKIKYHAPEPNDFAMMHEVITRRLNAYINQDPKFNKLPDLIMIDGGKGQLTAALKARDEMNFTIPMVGLAKKEEILFLPIEGEELAESEKVRQEALQNYSYDRAPLKHYEYEPVILHLHSPGLLLLRKLRDEAHRFAISYHRKLRNTTGTSSILDEVPGIGPRRKRQLLRTFGSVQKIAATSIDELSTIPTMTRKLAENVANALKNL